MLFKNKDLGKEFDRKGYITFSLLSESECQYLRDFYHQTMTKYEVERMVGHYDTSKTQNKRLIKEIDMKLLDFIPEKLSDTIFDFKYLASCYQIKEPGNNTKMSLHQDLSFVDETKFVSANLWIPLQDVNKENGCLYFIPGSHKVKNLRAMNSQRFCYSGIEEKLISYAEFIEIKQGDAVLFNHAVIHGSMENHSNDQRLAAVVMLGDKNAEWKIFKKENDSNSNTINEFNGLNYEAFINFIITGEIEECYKKRSFTEKKKIELDLKEFKHYIIRNSFLTSKLEKIYKILVGK